MDTRKLEEKKIQRKKFLYFIIAIVLFVTVLYDSYHYSLPFYYILFYFIGLGVGVLENLTSKIKWDNNQNKLVEEQDRVGFLLFIFLLFGRIFVLPDILNGTYHPIYLYDAISLISLGVFHKKIKNYHKVFHKIVFEYAKNNYNKISK